MMKTILLILLIFPFVGKKKSEPAGIVLEITGIKTSQKGSLKIGIFRKNGFLDQNKVIYKKIIPVDRSTMEVTFQNVDPGIYGAAVIQDQDKNGKLSTNLIGYPIEPYGFSNNQYGKFGPPDFNKVAFEVKSGKKTELKINLE